MLDLESVGRGRRFGGNLPEHLFRLLNLFLIHSLDFLGDRLCVSLEWGFSFSLPLGVEFLFDQLISVLLLLDLVLQF